jgi:hypothetical protein
MTAALLLSAALSAATPRPTAAPVPQPVPTWKPCAATPKAPCVEHGPNGEAFWFGTGYTCRALNNAFDDEPCLPGNPNLVTPPPAPRPRPTHAVDCKALGRAELDLYARSEELYVAAFGEHGAAADRDFNEATALSDAAATKHGEYVRCQRSSKSRA